MKKLLYISGAMVASFFALWISAHVFLRLKGPVLIERIVRDKTGLVVHVSAVRSHFLTSLELRNIELKKPISLVVPRLVISLHPSVFPLHVELFDPKIEWKMSGKSSMRSPIPLVPIPIQVDITNADINVSDAGPMWKTHGVDGTGRLSALAYDVQIKGVSSDVGHFEAQAALDNRLSRPWHASFLLPQVRLEKLSGEHSLMGDKITGLEGIVRLEGHVSGAWLTKKNLKDWNVAIVAKNVRWKPGVEAAVGPARGRALLTPRGIENIDFILDQAHVTGSVDSLWSAPRLNMTLRIPDGSGIKELLSSVGLDNAASSLGGWLGALVQVRGSPSRPSATGSFNAEPLVGPVRWPLLQGNFSYENNAVKMDADTLSGHVGAQGNFTDKRLPTIQLVLDGLSLEQLAKHNGWKNVHGMLDGKSDMAFDGGVASTSGSFKVRQFEWGRLKTKPLLEGTFLLSDRKVLLKTSDKALDIALARTKDVWKIQRGHAELNASADLAITGNFNPVQKSCDLSFDGKNIPPDAWPPLVARYPRIAGVVNLSGDVRGAFGALRTDMDVDFSKIQFVPNAKVWNGRAKVRGEGAAWAVEDFSVVPGYHGRVEWVSRRGVPDLHVMADVKNADPQFVFDVARSTAAIDGKLNGTVDVHWNGRDVVGISSAVWSPGRMGHFAFDTLSVGARFEKNIVTLEDFSLVRAQQGLRGHVYLTRSQKKWDVAGDVQFQNWGTDSIALNGETTLSGEAGASPLSADLEFTTPFLELNNVPLEDTIANAHYHDGSWSLVANAHDFVNVNLRGNLENETIQGSIEAHGLDLKVYVPRLLPKITEKPEGRADLVLNVSGTLEDPDARFSFKSADIVWRQEHFSPTLNATYRDGIITFRDSRIDFHKGGTLRFSGNVTLGAPVSFELNGDGKKLSLQSMIHLTNIPLHWQETLGGSFAVSSSSGNTNTTISFDGSHGGFAAFEDGGKISGSITGTDNEWDLSNVRVNMGDGYVSTLPNSKIYLERNGAATMHVGADVRNIRTGVLSLFGGVEVTGSWKREPGADPDSAPATVTELEIFAHSLWINHYILDGTITRLTIGNGQLELSPIPGSGQQMSGVLHYENFPTLRLDKFRLMDKGQEKIFLNGFIGQNKWDFELRAHDLNTDVLRSIVNSDLSLDGALNVNLKGLGTPANPDLSGHVIWRNGKVGFLPLDVAECDIHYQEHYLGIEKLNATRKNGYVMTGNARFYAGSDDTRDLDPDVDLQVDKGDLSFLRSVFPSVNHAKGTFSGRVRILKKSWGTSIAGFFDADKISLSTSHIPGLEKGVLKIQLDKNRLHIEEAKAHVGSGDLRLSGFIDFTEGVPSFYNLALQTDGERGIKIRVPELSISPGPVLGKIGLLRDRFAGASQGEPLVNLILKGPADAPLLVGAITMENAVFTYPPSSQQPQVEDENSDINRWIRHFMDTLQWDLSLIAGHRTWYQNELVDASIHGTLHFKGPTHDLNVQGTIETDQGALVYSGNEFQIRNASLEIETQGPLLNDASTKQMLVYLKASADRDVYYADNLGNGTEDTIVMTVDRSLLGEVQPRFYSKNNPNLSPEKALQLALGLPLSTPVDTDTLLPDQRATASASHGQDVDAGLRLGLIQLLDSSLASPLARAIARNTGLVDYIRVSFQEKDKFEETDPLRGSTSADASNNITQSEFLRYAKGTKVKFGKGFSDRLFADYSFRVDQYQNQVDLRHEIELSYRVHRNLFLRGTSELDREQTLGRPPDRRAVLENRWRFGLPTKPLADPGNPSNPAPKPS